MFGWKKKKKEKESTKPPASSSGFSSSLNNLLKGSPKGKRGSKYGKTDILSGSQTSGSNSPRSTTERSSVISNGSASPSPSSNSNQITSQFVHSLPPPEYSQHVPPDHSLLVPKATPTPDERSLNATYTPPPGYGLLKHVDRPPSAASNLSRVAALDQDGVDVAFDGPESPASSRLSQGADRSTYVAKPLQEWTEDEVLQWLNDSNMDYFADLFLGCDIDGDYLSQVTEDDLVDLEVEEAHLRKQLLHEIAKMKARQKTKTGQETATNEQEDEHSSLDDSESVHFGDTSDEDLFADSPKSPALSMMSKGQLPQPKAPTSTALSSSEKASPSRRVDPSIPVSATEDKQSPRRRGNEKKAISEAALKQALSGGNLPFNKKKVTEWNERDIIHWLDSINLGHLAQEFIDHSISGKELAEIDMTLLDEMEINSSPEREKILSTLYELTNPSSAVANNDVMSVINHASGYDKEKYMAAVSVLQSHDPDDVQLLPPEDKENLVTGPKGNESEEEEESDVGEDSMEEEGPKERQMIVRRIDMQEKKRIVGKMDVKEDDSDDETDDDWEDDEEEDDEDHDFEEQMNVVKKLEEERKTESDQEKLMEVKVRHTKMDIKEVIEDRDSEFDDSEDEAGDNKEVGKEDSDEQEDEQGAVEFFVNKNDGGDVHSLLPQGTFTSTPKDAKDKERKSAHIINQAESEHDDGQNLTPNNSRKLLIKQDSTGGTSKPIPGPKPVSGSKQVPGLDFSSVVSETNQALSSKSVSETKPMPGSEVPQGDSPRKDSFVVDPHREEMQRHRGKAARSESSRSSGSEKEEKKKKGGFSKLKEVISPSSWKKTHRDSNTVQVWTDVGQSGSGSKTLIVKLTEESTPTDLIGLCLNQLDLIEDPRLYRIIEAHIHGKDKGNDRDLEPEECPLIVQHGWNDHSHCRLEFRQKTAQGGAIKTVLRIPGQQPKGKLISISLSTPASEVVSLALRKFDLKNVDPSLFCLLEVDKDGDVCDVAEEAFPLQLDSHAFVLCDRSNRDLHWTTQEEEEANAGENRIERRDSLRSRASSKMSAISFGSSFGSSELLSSTRIDNEKLSKLEKEMASIQESLVPSKDPAVPTSTRPGQCGDVSPVPEIQVNDKEYNSSFEEMSKDLDEKKKQLGELQEALGDLGGSYGQMNVEARLQSLEQRLSSCPETDSLPERLLQLLADLEGASQEMEERQRDVDELKQGIELGGGLDDSALSRYELTIAEVALLKAQFDHSSLLSSMENAVADYQIQIHKSQLEEANKMAGMSPRGAPSIYNSLPQNQQFSVVSHLASAGSQGFHFQLGAQNNQGGVYIQSCSTAGVIMAGDRVIEVNGHSVLGSSVQEVNTLLNRSKKAHLVVMRAGHDQAELEVDRLTRQLATASEAYEACWQENKRLSDTVHRLRPLEHQVLELTQQKVTVQQLHQQIEALEARNFEISEELRMAHEGNINQSNQAIGRLQGDKERLEVKVHQQEQQIKKMETELAQKNSELTRVTTARDDAEKRLKSVDPNLKSTVKVDDLIASADNDTPLWEVLKPAQKSDILQVLQEELEEAGRQKAYLDQLYTLMLERAPELLEHLEQDFEASELSGDEEFC